DATLLFLYDAHLYPSNRALLETLQTGARALTVVLLRDPYDAEFLRPGVGAVTAYGWRRCQIEAALARILVGGDKAGPYPSAGAVSLSGTPGWARTKAPHRRTVCL